MENDKKLKSLIKTTIREFLNEQKLNEGILQCGIDELYKSVLEYVNEKLHYPKNSIKVELKDDYVLISLNYKINTDMSWNNLNDESKIQKLQTTKNNFKKMFYHFKDFCNKGVKGFMSTFKKDVTMITIESSIQLDTVKMVRPDKNNLNRYDKHVFRYTENNVSELSNNLDNYIKRYGDDDLDRVYVSVALFLKNIN